MTSLMEQMVNANPELGKLMAETKNEINESPFRDDILQELEGFTKEAAGGMFGSDALMAFGGKVAGPLGGAAKTIGATVGAGIALQLAGDAYDALKRGITKTRNYKSMLNDNPDLKQYPAERVQKTFDTLHRFNPEFAGNSQIAGAFVRKQQALEEFDTEMLTKLINSRKTLSDVKKLPTPDIKTFMGRRD